MGKYLDKVINIILFIYILSLYIFTYREGYNTISNYITIILCLLIWGRILILKRKVKLNATVIIYFLFFLVCLISVLYSIEPNLASGKCRTIFLICLLMISLLNYIDDKNKVTKVMSYFIISGFIASIYILINSDFETITRFGSELGNVNSVGIMIAISFIFGIYFIAERKKYYLLVILITMFATILLTGSRKSLLFIIFGTLYILFMKNKGKIFSLIKFFIIGGLVIVLTYYSVIKIPIFYNIIGCRMENLVEFVKTDETKDKSINERKYMIEFGFEKFRQKPIIGYGIDNYRVLFNQETGVKKYSHNNFVELMVDIGVVGLIIYYMISINLLKKMLALSSKNKDKILVYTYEAILLAYLILSWTLVFYDSKHLSIIIILASVICRVNKLEHKKFNV